MLLDFHLKIAICLSMHYLLLKAIPTSFMVAAFVVRTTSIRIEYSLA